MCAKYAVYYASLVFLWSVARMYPKKPLPLDRRPLCSG